jgi:hypothetical protein
MRQNSTKWKMVNATVKIYSQGSYRNSVYIFLSYILFSRHFLSLPHFLRFLTQFFFKKTGAVLSRFQAMVSRSRPGPAEVLAHDAGTGGVGLPRPRILAAWLAGRGPAGPGVPAGQGGVAGSLPTGSADGGAEKNGDVVELGR